MGAWIAQRNELLGKAVIANLARESVIHLFLNYFS